MHEKSTGCFSDRRSGPGKSFVSHFSWLIYQMYDTSEKSTHQLVMLIERPTIRFYGIGNPPHPALSPHKMGGEGMPGTDSLVAREAHVVKCGDWKYNLARMGEIRP